MFNWWLHTGHGRKATKEARIVIQGPELCNSMVQLAQKVSMTCLLSKTYVMLLCVIVLCALHGLTYLLFITTLRSRN